MGKIPYRCRRLIEREQKDEAREQISQATHAQTSKAAQRAAKDGETNCTAQVPVGKNRDCAQQEDGDVEAVK